MGAFNEIEYEVDGEQLRIQYKYGINRQYVYKIGQEVDFLSESPPEKELVIVGGTAKNSDGTWRFFTITFDGRRIESVREVSQLEYESLDAT